MGRALITGASRGIGAAIAEELARGGHTVILNYLSKSDAAEAVKERIEAAGGHAELARFDVANKEEAGPAVEQLIADGEPISILVNNAGVVRDKPFITIAQDDWDVVLQTTLSGFYNVTRPIVRAMLRRRWGRIVNISSISGVIGNRGQVNYSAAKAGLIGATRSLAIELAKRKITVNAVTPGLIETDMIAHAPIDIIMKHIPMRRLGQPEEVAKLVGFLVSEDSAYITGQVIGINGGMI